MPEHHEGPVAPGEIIGGKYRVERVLGAGGMGVVVAATHQELGSEVAIKLVRGEGARHPELLARFHREARIAARLKSDHVVRVIDVGTHPPGPGGAPYMVLEMLEGTDLSVVVSKRGPLPIDEAVGLVVEACEAIDEAHSLGVVHRDLKPANLFLANRAKGRPIVKVLDFGISSMAAGESDARLTATGSVMGTPLYMAPEQMLDARNADRRSDIWALGAILYELLSGAPPFPGNTFGAVHARLLSTEAASLSARRPDVPPELDALVLRCLRKQPELRFQTVAKLDQALRPFAATRIAMVSSPVVDPAVALPRHTTHVLSPGADPRHHTTYVLGGSGAVPTTIGTPASTTMPTSLPQPSVDDATLVFQPQRPRSNARAIMIAGGGVAVGVAAALSIAAVMRSERSPAPQSSPAASAVNTAPTVIATVMATAAPAPTVTTTPTTRASTTSSAVAPTTGRPPKSAPPVVRPSPPKAPVSPD